jgi:hypothetical protein
MDIDMSNISDETIKKALIRYKKQKEMSNLYYKNRYANDPEFREKHKQKSREYYYKNKEKIKEKYQLEKKYKQALRKYNYYKDNNELDKYIKLYSKEWDTYFKDI